VGHVKGPARLPAAWSTGPGRPYPMICSLYRMCVVELLQVVMFKPALPKCPARQSLALQLPSHLPCAACCGGCGDVQPSLQRLSMGGHGHYSALILRREQRACDEARGVRTRLHTSTLHEHQGSTGLAQVHMELRNMLLARIHTRTSCMDAFTEGTASTAHGSAAQAPPAATLAAADLCRVQRLCCGGTRCPVEAPRAT
jgi:hypothetical protein